MTKILKYLKKYSHLLIILFGIILISSSVFHRNMWFDESYSVGMASHSFIDIYSIGSNDVHPILYYYILHIIYIFFGTNIYLYRFVSMLPIIILGILGYTHIRKDFGENVGKLFSFFVLFLPLNCVYAGEIRMYSWAMLFVSLMAIYAYRICIDSSFKNWILFTIFSVSSAYIHYYALATSAIINFILFIYIIIRTIKNRKSSHKMTDLKRFIISAITQILIYSPWIICVWIQILGLSNSFWIDKPNAMLIFKIFIFQFTGNLDVEFINPIIAFIFGLIILSYTIYSIIRLCNNYNEDKKYIKAGLFSIGIYLLVVLFVYIISLKKPILYPRYFLNLTGLFIFFISVFIAKGGKKFLTITICILTILIAGIVNYNVLKMNYAKSNNEPIAFVENDLQENDMFLFENESGSGFVMSMQFDSIQNCFYDADNWNVEPAYKAFGKNLLYIKKLEDLDDYNGRIWIIDADKYVLYEKLLDLYTNENITLIKQNKYHTEYHGYDYAISLIEKKGV